MQKKVSIATAIMTGSILFSRLTGLLREMAVSHIGGIAGNVDAYQVSFIIPEILNHIVASGFLSITFIPIFAGYLSLDQEEEGWRVFSIILNVFGALLLLLILATFFLAPHLVSLFAPGEAFSDPARRAAAVRMTRIIIPAQFFFFAGGLFMAVQFAKEKFVLPALAPLVYNAGIIVGGLLLGPHIGMEGFSWGVMGGAIVGNFLIQYWGARKVGMRYSFNLDITHPDVKQYMRLTLPLIVGLTMMFSTEIFLKYFGSYLPEGSIAGLNYALRIMLMLVGFFGQAVGVASFPFMARLAAEKRFDEMNRLLNSALRYIALVIPLSVLIMILRREVVMILFEHGEFDQYATQLTAGILGFILIGAFAFAAQTVVVRGYFATQNTLFPALFGTLAVLASIPLYYYGMQFYGVFGVALALSLSAIFQVVLIYAAWNKHSANRESRNVYGFYLRIMVISCLLGAGAEVLKDQLLIHWHPTTRIDNFAVAVAMTFLFVPALTAAGYILKIPEIIQMSERFFQLVKGGKPK